MPYDLFEHRHRFAVWAAARATQRNFTSVERLRDALQKCGIKEFVNTAALREIDEARYRELHRDWCRAIIQDLAEGGVADPTFGRAAKLVGVYLKAMVVIGPASGSSLACVAHPPIDRILLKKIGKAAEMDSHHRRTWGKVNWTQLTEEAYYSLIDQLRGAVSGDDPFWTLERFWTVTDENEG